MPHLIRLIILALLMVATGSPAKGQRTSTSTLASELCACIGAIDPGTDGRMLELETRACLNRAIKHHPQEVVALLGRYPAPDRTLFALGLVVGSVLDRECPDHPLIKARLRLLLPQQDTSPPNT